MPAIPTTYFPVAYEHEPLTANAIGHLAGAIVFGIFLALALRGGAGRRLRQNWLSVASAGLAFLWNAGSFVELMLPPGGALYWAVSAANFACLSLLPAVLLHLSLKGKSPAIRVMGYSISAIATAMHLWEPMAPSLPLHEWALRAITFGFGALTVAYAAGVLREGKEARRRTPRILASMCLLLFAVSFSHFAPETQPWKELIVHHAGIPAALVILLQDYRFVFLDAFVRFLANVILAALLGYAGIRLGAVFSPARGSSSPLAGIWAVAGLSGLLILFAYLRGLVQRWLTKVVFRSGGLERAIQQLHAKAGEMRDEREYLGWAAERVAAAVGASRFAVLGDEAETAGEAPHLNSIGYPALADEQPALARNPEWNWVEAVVPIRLAREDVRYLLLGRRRGGMRYLSEDLRRLNYVATVVAEEVERFRATEMQRLVSEAELRALHSQINPHFLFNALNTIYGIIPREAAAARRTVLHLAEIFRYFLQSDKKLIPLCEELKIVKAYLEIEQLRLGPRLRVEIDVDAEAERTQIPILSVQPLVENAIKHGLSARPEEGWLRLRARAAEGALTVTVEDSGAPAEAGAPDSHRGAGVGLANVTRRLQLCYGPASGVTVRTGPFGTRAEFTVPLAEAHARK